ncbi:MAG: hypothetical protein ABEJ56_03765 [Candidatus Nanohaloarchaea archaeon]
MGKRFENAAADGIESVENPEIEGVNANISSGYNILDAYISISTLLNEFNSPTMVVEAKNNTCYEAGDRAIAEIKGYEDCGLFNLIFKNSEELPGLYSGEEPEAVVEDRDGDIQSGQVVYYQILPYEMVENDPVQITGENPIVQRFFSD